MLRALLISIFGLLVNYILLHFKSDQVLYAYVYCISAANLFFVFVNWGGREYIVKTLTKNPGKLPVLLNSIINSRIILFAAAALFCLFIPTSLSFKAVIVIYIIFKALNAIYESVITVQKQFHRFLILDFVINTAFLAVILLDGNKSDALLFLMQFLAAELVRVVINLFLFRKELRFRLDLRSGLSTIKDSAPFFYMAFTGFICSRADLYVVGLKQNKEELSFYFIILNLVGLCHVTYTTFQNTYSSNIFRYTTRSFEKFSRYSLLLGLIFSLCATVAIYMINLTYYHTPLSGLFVMFILLNIFVFTQVLTQMYKCTRLEKQTFALRVLIVSGLVNILVAYVLLDRFGMLGAFIGNTAGSVCTFALLKAGMQKAQPPKKFSPPDT